MSAPNIAKPPAPDNAGAAEPRPKGRRWGHDARHDPVAAYLAPRLGMKPQGVGHLMRDIGHRCAEIVRAFRALGDDVRLARFWAPLQAAYEQREAPPLCDAIIRMAREASAAETVAMTDFLLDRSDAHLERDVRASDRLILRETALRDAMAAELLRRRAAR